VICGCKGGGLINGEEVLVHYTRAKDGGVCFGRCGSSYLQLSMDWSVSNGVFMRMDTSGGQKSTYNKRRLHSSLYQGKQSRLL